MHPTMHQKYRICHPAPLWYGRLKLPLPPPECSTLLSPDWVGKARLSAVIAFYAWRQHEWCRVKAYQYDQNASKVTTYLFSLMFLLVILGHEVGGGGYSFTLRLYVCVCVCPLHNFANISDINFKLGPR